MFFTMNQKIQTEKKQLFRKNINKYDSRQIFMRSTTFNKFEKKCWNVVLIVKIILPKERLFERGSLDI